MTLYRTIVADPPWDHSDGTGGTRSRGEYHQHPTERREFRLPYPTMTLDEIKDTWGDEALNHVGRFEDTA